MRKPQTRRKFTAVEWWWSSRFCKIYTNMLDRCFNPRNICYKKYWWRGITCLWGSIDEFTNDMYESYKEHVKQYWEKDTTLDRIDNNWNYCKENCRWATLKEQANNKNTNIRIVIDWTKYTSKEYAEEYGIDIILARQRIKLYNRGKLSMDAIKTHWYANESKVLITINWEWLTSKDFASKYWISLSSAQRRIKDYKDGKIWYEFLTYYGRIPSKRNLGR
jgi:hypothetical protein